MDAEKKGVMEGQKEIMSEAKSSGYDVKALKRIIADRKRDANDLAEEQAIVEMYKSALGI
jgi:uncharacterized protein (UPF0335 family)